jgi:homoserine O-succinyltransferase/O-acetyltransferase
MPVLIDNLSPDHHLSADVENNRAKISREASGARGRAVNIGLINNMSDGALISTERQLFNLLNSAAGKHPVRLCLYALPTVSRSDWGRQHIRRFYSDVEELWHGDLDGLIVTGAEPRTPTLTQEPYWRSLVQVIDWAQQNTASTVWSCLAVHGAVLYLDGIERTPLEQKCVGIFEQAKNDDHPLLRGVPSRIGIPHSRWNEVSEESLAAHGYSILTRSESAGVDMFVKQQKHSLFVYFQGHPEYDAHSLLGEYRRDVKRFLRRESESYPTIPRGYFDDRATELLIAFQSDAELDRRSDMLARFPVDSVGVSLKNTWQSAANRIYRNWIRYVSRSALCHNRTTAFSTSHS